MQSAATPSVLTHPSYLFRSLLLLSTSCHDLCYKHRRWQASVRCATSFPAVRPQAAAAALEPALQTSAVQTQQITTLKCTSSRERRGRRGSRTTSATTKHETSAICNSSIGNRTRRQTVRNIIASTETNQREKNINAAADVYEASQVQFADTAFGSLGLPQPDSAQVESQPLVRPHGSNSSNNTVDVVLTGRNTHPGSETAILLPRPVRNGRFSKAVVRRINSTVMSGANSDSNSSSSNLNGSSIATVSNLSTVVPDVTEPSVLMMCHDGGSSRSSSAADPVKPSSQLSNGVTAVQPQLICREGGFSKKVTRHHNKAAATADNSSSIAAAAATAQAADPDRLNSVMRVIRIMQLRKQQESSSRNSTSSKDLQLTEKTAEAPAAEPAEGLLQQQQQQQQEEEEASQAAAAAAASGRRVAALPAEEVLMTDTSHMNPVYRRIRLQELRLRLQQQLRGPQLQRQLLQVQQQQQQLLYGHHHQQQQQQPQRQQGWEKQQTSDVECDPSVTTDSSAASKPILQQEISSSSSSSRGPTQGLNSVERTIRIAQLQHILQHRRNSTHSTNTSSRGTSSIPARLNAGAPHSAAAAAAGPGAAGSMGGGTGRNSAARIARSSRRGTSVQPSTGRELQLYQLQSQQQQQQQQQQAAVSAAVAEQQLVVQLVAAGVPAATAQALLEAADNTPAAHPFSSCRAQILDRLFQLQELLCLPSVAAAAKVMIKQPNLLVRKPETLRRNVLQLLEALHIPPAQLRQLLCRYPAALDMSPVTAAGHAAAIAATLEVSDSTAVALICRCPRLLGLSPAAVAKKLGGVQAVLDLPTLAAAVDVVQGFPALLGLSTETLDMKWRQLKQLAALKPQWQQQLQQLQQGARAGARGLLGRLLAA